MKWLKGIVSLFKGAPPQSDVESFQKGECPNCGSTHFLLGPSGGISQNVQCCGCKKEYNVAWAMGTVLSVEEL